MTDNNWQLIGLVSGLESTVSRLRSDVASLAAEVQQLRGELHQLEHSLTIDDRLTDRIGDIFVRVLDAREVGPT